MPRMEAQVNRICAVVGTGIGDKLTAEAEFGEGSVSGAYFRVFFPKDTDRSSNNRVWVSPAPVTVEVEKFYTLPLGSPIRVEVDITAGDAGLPVTLNLISQTGGQAHQEPAVQGFTGETLVCEVSAPAKPTA